MIYVSHREFNRIKDIFDNCGISLTTETHGSNREPIDYVNWYFKSTDESEQPKVGCFKYNSKYKLFGITEEGYGDDRNKEYYIYDFGEYMLYLFGKEPPRKRERSRNLKFLKDMKDKKENSNGSGCDGISW